ncbi:hypothetical protein ABZ477_07680 [Microbacterium sp. NPDC019599]|uniref:hypothetical protein n=1 Tax=Microbacterium sp. NPDC019599 TaxID=3154690 RepID=UPI0033C8C1AC
MTSARSSFAASVAVAAVVLAGSIVTVAPAEAAPLADGAETFEVASTVPGDIDSLFMTADAQRVYYSSDLLDVIAGNADGVRDVIAEAAVPGSADPFSGSPVLVSVPDGPVGDTRANGASTDPVASADGRYVAFVSGATNLVPEAGTPGRTQIFVRDTLLDRTFRVSSPGVEPDGSSYAPDMSDDGRYVVFTTDAANLTAGDANGARDAVLADLDANADGVHGDVSITRVASAVSLETGSHNPVISGDGSTILFLSRKPADSAAAPAETDYLQLTARGATTARVIADEASSPSIDSAGTAFAYLDATRCGGVPTVAAGMLSAGIPYTIGLGQLRADNRSGWVDEPTISNDGSTVAWTTTVPEFDFGNGGVPAPELADPVVRIERVSWYDAMNGTDQCEGSGVKIDEWQDVAPGGAPAISASGRTVAFASADRDAVTAVDRHTNDGISVTSVQGTLVTPGYMSQVDTSTLSVAALRDAAGAIANAPVYRLPVYRLPVYRLPVYRLPVYRLLIDDSPVYRLPVYRLPVYRLPVYRLDLPGGWAQILEGSPYAGELLQSVTLHEVLTWAADTLADQQATDAARASAERIQSLTLADMSLDGSGLAGLSIASYVLGSAPLEHIPLPGQEDTPIENWQALAEGQGIGLTITGETLLAELDSAGLDIARSRIDEIPLPDLPSDETLLSEVLVTSLFLEGTPLGSLDVERLSPQSREALFGTSDVGGTLAAPTAPLLESAIASDLAKGAPADVTFGALLLSLLDLANYPWEQIAASDIGPENAAQDTPGYGCTANVRCDYRAPFRFTFDAGPGEATDYVAPTASVTLPAGTVLTQLFAKGSGPGALWDYGDQEFSGPHSTTGRRVEVPLADQQAGTVFELSPWFSGTSQVGWSSAEAVLTTGDLEATGNLADLAPLDSWDDFNNNYVDGQWQGDPKTLQAGRVYYEWLSPSWLDNDDFTGANIHSPVSDDEDYFLVDAPEPGQRLVVSTNAMDGQISLTLYSPSAQAATPLGVPDAGAAAGTGVAEQAGYGAPAQAGADTAAEVPGQTVVDQVVVRGGDAAHVEAASTDAAQDDQLMIRVASGSGAPSESLYSLRVSYVRDAPEKQCTPWTPPATADPADPGIIGFTDVVTPDTNTIYLFDEKRYGDTYGAAQAAAVRSALRVQLDGEGKPGSTVSGAVLSIDDSEAVRAARTTLDANPCSLEARRALSTEINRYVAAQVGGEREHITSVVIVGGDDIIPFAPVRETTSQFTESGHAAELRLTSPLGGPVDDPCPADIPEGTADPCETPLSAAAAANTILSDDPYGLATAYETLGGYLYVPSAGLGRLVETPDEILATIGRFAEADGELDASGNLPADSTVTAGYGAWSKLPQEVTAALAWRSGQNQQLSGEWTAEVMDDAIFPEGQDSPAVVSVNTHADERRMLPGLPGAEEGRFEDSDLFLAADHDSAASLADSLVFLIGCHAGNNLPTAYYGDVADWVDVFSSAAGYVGNTGYGLANDTTNALSARLLSLYASWIGVETDASAVTAAQALTYAKQTYLGGLGLFSGYDEKVLMQAVFYGLPMYTFAGPTKSAPLPELPEGLTPVEVGADGVSTASLSLTPSFEPVTATGSDGVERTYLTADGQEPAVVAGQPILPRIVSKLDEAPAGQKARGVLLTGLTSTSETLDPAFGTPSVGTPDPTQPRGDVAFPSSFAGVTRQDTPDGPIDLLVVTPARVELRGTGQGRIERFTQLDLEVVYGDAASTDETAPLVRSVEPVFGDLKFDLDGTGSEVKRVVLLVQREGQTVWESIPVTKPVFGTTWSASPDEGPYRWILQVVDAAGNVATETQRGHLEPMGAAAPALSGIGDDTALVAGQSLARTVEVTDAAPGERLTATVEIAEYQEPQAVDGEEPPADAVPAGAVVSSAVIPVSTGDDGVTRVPVDVEFPTPGRYVVSLDVCRAASCTTEWFVADVDTPDHAPTVTLSLLADTNPVDTKTVLTADAEGTDPDGEDVSIAYEWFRNGVPIPVYVETLDLDGIAEAGDVISVTVTPWNDAGTGHAASASTLVVAAPEPPPGPTITATATTASGDPYVEGVWSRTAVTVEFECTAGAPLLQPCPAPQVVDEDTTPMGVQVTGTVTDMLGRTESATVLVRVDRTAPVLAPTVEPRKIVVGTSGTAKPNATDAASGVASQSCDVPRPTKPGRTSVTCRATDVAGNTATAQAFYIGSPKAPPHTTPPSNPKPTPTPTPSPRPPQTSTGGGSTGAVIPLLPGVDLPDRQALGPVAADGSSVYARGSAVPIIFRAHDDGGEAIGTPGYVVDVVLVSSQDLDAGASVNEGYFVAFPFVYAEAAEVWLGTIPTADLAGGTRYTYRVDLSDGTSFTVTFGVSG